MRPWYMVARLIRSMCCPHVQPSACWGVLWMWVLGVSSLSNGGATSSPKNHWWSVLCILMIAGGMPEVEGVIVVVCMVVDDEGCEVDVVVYVKDRDRVK